jgi:hypothetical protein
VFKAKSYLLKILEIAPDHLKANNLLNQLNWKEKVVKKNILSSENF